MNESWVSGSKNTEAIDKLRTEIAGLEQRRDELLDKNKRKVFEWASYVLSSPRAPKDLDSIRHEESGQEARDVVALYELLTQEILDKEASLGEKLDDQARSDSLT